MKRKIEDYENKLVAIFCSSIEEWDKIKSIYYESTKILFFIGCFLFLNINLNIVELLHFLPSLIFYHCCFLRVFL